MAARQPGKKPAKPRDPAREDVESFLSALDHPRKAEIQALRKIILAVDRRISEGIKWNAPSFRTEEYFATFHLRAKEGVQVILHRGAKKREPGTEGPAVADPDSLLEWLAADRALVRFSDRKDITAKRAAFTEILRQWITHG